MTAFAFCWMGLLWFAAIWPFLAGMTMAMAGDIIDAGFQWTIALLLIFVGSLPLLVPSP
jgi:hypothetical protein